MSSILDAAAEQEAAGMADRIKTAGKSIADYVSDHPEVLERLRAELPTLRQALAARGESLRNRVPEQYAGHVDRLLARTDDLTVAIAARQAEGLPIADQLFALDAARAEAEQYEAIAANTQRARLLAVSSVIAEIAVKLLTVAALAAL